MNITMKNTSNKKKLGNITSLRKKPAYRALLEIMDARVRFAIEVSEARTSKGWSQQTLARRAKTTQKIISKIENAETNIGFDLLQRITKHLGLEFRIGRAVFVERFSTQTTNQKITLDQFLNNPDLASPPLETKTEQTKDEKESLVIQ